MTRPKPTIYGNCDSWSFIVGKKPGAYRLNTGQTGSLQRNNSNSIHSLSTIPVGEALDNLWVICGPTVHSLNSSRIVGLGIFDMPLIID